MTGQATDSASDRRRRVVVVGAGIAGLAAAWHLVTHQEGDDLDVLVLEASARTGGKLAVGELDGVQIDLGAESMLARRPEAIALARGVGLSGDLCAPRPLGAQIWSRDQRHRLPPGTLMGVPSGPGNLLGLLTPDELAVVAAEPGQIWPARSDQSDVDEGSDIDVASFVSARVGSAVVDRLVEPLLGGVYAGRAGLLSLRATVPALWDAASNGGSVVLAAQAAARRGGATQTPVFNGIRGGVGRLPRAVSDALQARGAVVQTRTTVRGLVRLSRGWRVLTGPTSEELAIDADAVVLAVPATPASRLLRPHAPHAARVLSDMDYASVAIVSLLLDRAAVSGLDGSGFLVPPIDGRYVKAATFSSSKWQWLDECDPEHVVVRASVGRHGGASDLQIDDDEMVRRVLTDLRRVPGLVVPQPIATRVTRWGGGLPQYAVGHVSRIAQVEAASEAMPGLRLAGAAYDGVGIPACIASGRRAAQRVLTHLGAAPAGGGQ